MGNIVKNASALLAVIADLIRNLSSLPLFHYEKGGRCIYMIRAERFSMVYHHTAEIADQVRNDSGH